MVELRVLMLGEWGYGGIQCHVRCLLSILKEIAAESESDVNGFRVYCIGEDEPYKGKSNGHDVRKFFQIMRVVKRFRPDVIHIQKFSVMMCIYLKLFTRIPRIFSLHTRVSSKASLKERILHWLLGPCYYLPVSERTWQRFKLLYPNVRGEVFFNPIRIGIGKDKVVHHIRGHYTIGLIGRFADVKDWRSFVDVCKKITSMGGRNNTDKNRGNLARVANIAQIKCWGIGVTEKEALAKFGDSAQSVEWKGVQPNGREWIGKMDVFVLTSKHEEMPTVVLEAFAERTAICGFIPEGGMSEILEFSSGPLREVFIKERNTSRLAEIVMLLLKDEEKRKSVIDDGWQILVNHFDAEKNCRGQLMEIYRRIAR